MWAKDNIHHILSEFVCISVLSLFSPLSHNFSSVYSKLGWEFGTARALSTAAIIQPLAPGKDLAIEEKKRKGTRPQRRRD